MNITNNTFEDIAYLANRVVNGVCGPLILLSVILLLILSSCWSLYFLLDIIKGYRSKDVYINRNMREEVIQNILNNMRIRRVKKYVLFAICFSECVFTFSVILVLLTAHFEKKHPLFDRPSSTYHKLSFQFSYSSESVWARFEIALGFNFFLLLLMLIVILTQYMANCYNFFKTKYSLILHSIKAIGIVTLLTLLGTFRISMSLYSILYIAFLIFEFILFSRASRKLRKFLYSRYFDAKFHEYQSTRVVAYYKGAYKEYGITSLLLSLSLASHMLSISLLLIHSIVIAILFQPENFAHILIGQDMTFRYSALPTYLRIYDRFMSSIIEVLFTLGMLLLVSPYVFVSLNYIVFFIKRRIRPRQYRFPYFSDPDKVKYLISGYTNYTNSSC